MRLAAGTKVKRSGAYNIIHYGHRAPHTAILREGELFPDCRRCGTGVLFEFFKPLTESDELEHIGYDRDFIDSVLHMFRQAG